METTPPDTSLGTEFLDAVRRTFEYHKTLVDNAVVQVDDAGLRRTLDQNTNSIAIIMRHIAGNLKSRWTDSLTTDGEKPWRDRDQEFVESNETREELLARWEGGWRTLFDAIHSFGSRDLLKIARTRGEPQSLVLALQRSLAHISYHCGQIVLLARIFCPGEWRVLTIARGKSEEFNAKNWAAATPPHAPST